MTGAFPSEIHIPDKVLSGKNGVLEFPGKAASFGSRGVIVHGASVEKNGLKSSLVPFLKKAGVETAWFCRGKAHPHALQEASVQEIRDVIALGKNTNARWIAGIGGGSVLDLAKAAAGLYHAHKDPVYYQEGGKLTEKGIPFLAVPTTAGSGSEATLNAVIINPGKKVKLSIRHPAFLAAGVILDPELLKTVPESVMAHSGMDALVQAYESYTSKNATLFTETLALRAIEMIGASLIPAAKPAPTDIQPTRLDIGERDKALHDMLFASFLAGLAFSHSRLGVIHGIAHSLGVLYGVPHGLVCAACFIPSIKMNREAMGEKYARMSRALGGDLTEKITTLQTALGITSPFKGKPVIEKEKIIAETLRSGSTAANPKPVEREDVKFLLGELF